MIVVLALVAGGALLVAGAVRSRNVLVSKRFRVLEALAQLDVQLARRHAVVPLSLIHI